MVISKYHGCNKFLSKMQELPVQTFRLNIPYKSRTISP